MHNKLKLPLTAVFSFLLGSVIFFPWGSPQEKTEVSNNTADNEFIFDRSINKSSQQLATINSAASDSGNMDSDLVNKLTIQSEKNTATTAPDASIEQKLKSTAKIKVDTNKKSQTILVKYHFSREELFASNLSIKNQLKKSSFSYNENKNRVLETIKRSGEAIPVVLNDIKREINNVITKVINTDKTPKVKETIIVKKVDYQFPDRLLELSNQAIQKQLSRYVLSNETVDTEVMISSKLDIAELEVPEISENEQQQIDETEVLEIEEVDILTAENEIEDDSFASTRSFFDDSDLEKSNLAIQVQLRGYQGQANQNQKSGDEQQAEISEESIEVIEYSESEIEEIEFTEVESDETDYWETKEYKKIVFTKSELKLSNLAILQQLSGYKKATKKKIESDTALSKDNSENNAEQVYEDEQESELLISNSEHDSDEDDNSNVIVKYSKGQFRKNTSKLPIKKQQQEIDKLELEDDEDEDEYSGERIVFNQEPSYFTDSFEKEATNTVENNLELPDIENIDNIVSDTLTDITEVIEIEDLEVIEEIDINDDGNLVTSVVN